MDYKVPQVVAELEGSPEAKFVFRKADFRTITSARKFGKEDQDPQDIVDLLNHLLLSTENISVEGIPAHEIDVAVWPMELVNAALAAWGKASAATTSADKLEAPEKNE